MRTVSSMSEGIPRAARAVASHLQPGEDVLSACLCQPRGTMAAGALGGGVGALIAARGRKDDKAHAEAAGHPYLAKPCVLVPTTLRLLVVNGKHLLGAIEAHELAGAEVLKKNAISPWKIRLDLANGSAITMEANRMMKPDRLVENINRLASSSS